MLGMIYEESKHSSDAFSAATLFYARLRRVTGRVVDALYLVENQDYARYAMDFALKANDPELDRLVRRLHAELDFPRKAEPDDAVMRSEEISMAEPDYKSEATEEEIYQAQVSHHYIGALR